MISGSHQSLLNSEPRKKNVAETSIMSDLVKRQENIGLHFFDDNCGA